MIRPSAESTTPEPSPAAPRICTALGSTFAATASIDPGSASVGPSSGIGSSRAVPCEELDEPPIPPMRRRPTARRRSGPRPAPGRPARGSRAAAAAGSVRRLQGLRRRPSRRPGRGGARRAGWRARRPWRPSRSHPDRWARPVPRPAAAGPPVRRSHRGRRRCRRAPRGSAARSRGRTAPGRRRPCAGRAGGVPEALGLLGDLGGRAVGRGAAGGLRPGLGVVLRGPCPRPSAHRRARPGGRPGRRRRPGRTRGRRTRGRRTCRTTSSTRGPWERWTSVRAARRIPTGRTRPGRRTRRRSRSSPQPLAPTACFAHTGAVEPHGGSWWGGASRSRPDERWPDDPRGPGPHLGRRARAAHRAARRAPRRRGGGPARPHPPRPAGHPAAAAGGHPRLGRRRAARGADRRRGVLHRAARALRPARREPGAARDGRGVRRPRRPLAAAAGLVRRARRRRGAGGDRDRRRASS